MVNKCLFAKRLLFASGEGDGATSPSFKTSCTPNQAFSTSLEVLIPTWYVQEGCKQEYLTHGKQMPICKCSTLTSVEGDEATSPSFTTHYMQIHVSNASLEAFIATWYVQRGCKREHFTQGKQMLVSESFTFCERRGRRGNVALLCNTLRADWGYLTSPAGDKPIMASSYWALLPFPPFKLSLLVGLCSDSHALLDSVHFCPFPQLS